MTATELLPAPTAGGNADHLLDHVVCFCDPETALCGQDVTGADWVHGGGATAADCVVCVDLEERPCPKCGWTP